MKYMEQNDGEHLSLNSIFDQIRFVDENNNPYWNSRDMCRALGYSDYYKFKRVVEKAIATCEKEGKNVNEHFILIEEVLRLPSGTFRKIENIRLTKYAALLVVNSADIRKQSVKLARFYFKEDTPETETADNVYNSNILFYNTPAGEVKIEVLFNNENFWLSQKRMSEIFGVDTTTINYHLKQIFATGELDEQSTVRKIPVVQQEGTRNVKRWTAFYNLDVIISVGYRVNSNRATQFRMWATRMLKEFLIKGFIIDDDRLKQGTHFGRDYFDELLERIREIRSSERRYYQKITDIYAECSIDYDMKSDITKEFFRKVQNMMHWAITHQTAAEIIHSRADASKPAMGLMTWKNAPEGRIQKSDVNIAKNYLNEQEVRQLNLLTTAYLDFAELQATRGILMRMEDWSQKLDSFLQLNNYGVLKGEGSITPEDAKSKAYDEYSKFLEIQDKNYLSDFDKRLKQLGTKE